MSSPPLTPISTSSSSSFHNIHDTSPPMSSHCIDYLHQICSMLAKEFAFNFKQYCSRNNLTIADLCLKQIYVITIKQLKHNLLTELDRIFFNDGQLERKMIDDDDEETISEPTNFDNIDKMESKNTYSNYGLENVDQEIAMVQKPSHQRQLFSHKLFSRFTSKQVPKGLFLSNDCKILCRMCAT